MSKKKGKIKLIEGRFYNVRDGSTKGHPGKVFKADYNNGEYDSVVTGTTRKSGMIPINPTSKGAKNLILRKDLFEEQETIMVTKN